MNYSIQLLYRKFSPLDSSTVKTDARIELQAARHVFRFPRGLKLIIVTCLEIHNFALVYARNIVFASLEIKTNAL